MTNRLRQSSWVVTLSLAAMAVAYLTLLWMPGYRAVQALREQVEAKRMFIGQSTGLSAALFKVQKELDRAEATAARWEKVAPRKRDIPRLYGKIDAAAKDAHLAIARFDPQPFVTYEKLQEIPITMSCSGTFAQIFSFLRKIEGLPTTIWVESMRLERASSTTKNVQCEVNLVVFSDNSQNSDYAKHSD
jgi:Tfp pilus assembly protein PilO